jgi:hypothetical protein
MRGILSPLTDGPRKHVCFISWLREKRLGWGRKHDTRDNRKGDSRTAALVLLRGCSWKSSRGMMAGVERSVEETL